MMSGMTGIEDPLLFLPLTERSKLPMSKMLLGPLQATTEETSGGWEVKEQQRRKISARAERIWLLLQSPHDSPPTREWSYGKVTEKSYPLATVQLNMSYIVTALCISGMSVTEICICFVQLDSRDPWWYLGPFRMQWMINWPTTCRMSLSSPVSVYIITTSL